MGYCVSYNYLNYEFTEKNWKAMLKKYPNIKGELDDNCFCHSKTNTGYVIDDWDGEKWRDQEEVLIKISEFAEEGSGSGWTGEDGESWEYRVQDGRAVEYNLVTEAALMKEALQDIFSRYPEEATKYINSNSLDIRTAAKDAVGGG